MSKPHKLPPCGTCDLTMPTADPKTLWCHGAPPTAHRRTIVNTSTGTPVPEEVRYSDYPPVGADAPGCAMHPRLRGKMGRGL